MVENLLGHLSIYKESDFEEQVPIKVRENGSVAKYKCIDCGIPVYRSNTRCAECHLKKLRKDRPNREEPKKLIKEKSFLEIGQMFNVSDNVIRKWCDTYKLPRKKTEINSYTDEEWMKM